MKLNTEHSALFNRFLTDRRLAAAGVKPELIGRHVVRLIRSGRMLGMWKQSVGQYQWIPAGHSAPEASVFSAEDAVRHSSRSLLAN